MRCSTTAASAVKPTLIDRIQDRYGRTVYKHDQRECRGCDAAKWANQPEPTLVDRREQVLDPMTAYQITSMMEGVVQRGTAARSSRGRQADRRQDRHHQRRKRRLVRRLFARSRGRRLSWATTSRATSADGATGGHAGGPDRARFHEGRACRQAGRFRSACRPVSSSFASIPAPACARARRERRHPRSLQARHRAARQLFGHRLWGKIPTASRCRMPVSNQQQQRQPRGGGRGFFNSLTIRSGTGGLY